MKEFLTDILSTMGLAVWVEITTEKPRCTYYFGPFNNPDEAEEAKPGYLEDLRQEGTQGIVATVKRCKPAQLTIADDIDPNPDPGMRVFSGQMP